MNDIKCVYLSLCRLHDVKNAIRPFIMLRRDRKTCNNMVKRNDIINEKIYNLTCIDGLYEPLRRYLSRENAKMRFEMM